MSDSSRQSRIHDLDATLRVGKHGIESVADELDDQLENTDLVKVKFLRSSRGGTTAEELAEDLAEMVNAEVIQVRGHTAVFKK
ncbi:YhbY family RNA-binding protein [Haloarcula sp. CBA1130]|uniref:YhbY family RNA-binding protein n=1 Tax=unclassified Haloarcula TaxID=2624677 RepID=UPI0012455414|nr:MULTISPECIES: YhbY family RNA-binding protein [unclassified Haloarcula]KAA9398084.1 YhbY family RNA-binding protein [Haloarcula sp. CBA1129]KAA9402228.1 YhbY family RNA-binding protein [Haloarcula sp. CBA1130]